MQYRLTRSWRARSLRLRLDREGNILVRAPVLLPKILIDNFVAEHETWITNKRKDLRAQVAKKDDSLKIFGETYQLKFVYKPDLQSGFVLAQKTLFYNSSLYALSPKKTSKLTNAENAKLERFLRQTIRQYVSMRVPQLHAQMQIAKPLGRITIKDQTSRWGSCSSDGNLNFNYHLVHYSPAIIDYVLIHELAHLVHLNHSDKFWALVAKYDGAYKSHRRALK